MALLRKINYLQSLILVALKKHIEIIEYKKPKLY